MSKTIFITGSTDGIGKLAAIKLAKEGHELYLHGRSPRKLSAVISEIKQLAQNENIKGFVADFSDLGLVRHMAGQILEELSHVDVLINNAGIFKSPVSHNREGLDIRIVVNYLAPYVLTNGLLPLMNRSADARILNVSSAGQSTVSHDVLTGKEKQTEMETYTQSKLAITMWSFHLSKKMPAITVMAVNPGSLLNTKMVQEAVGHFWSSADKGANILYDLAILDEYRLTSGKYYDNDKGSFGEAHPDAYDESAIERLIDVTNSIVSI